MSMSIYIRIIIMRLLYDYRYYGGHLWVRLCVSVSLILYLISVFFFIVYKQLDMLLSLNIEYPLFASCFWIISYGNIHFWMEYMWVVFVRCQLLTRVYKYCSFSCWLNVFFLDPNKLFVGGSRYVGDRTRANFVIVHNKIIEWFTKPNKQTKTYKLYITNKLLCAYIKRMC